MALFDHITEKKIQDAIRNKEFENLNGFGKPIDNSEYFSVSQEYRLTNHILKNSGAVPEEITLKKDIANLNKQMDSIIDPITLNKLKKEKNCLQTKYNLFAEKRKLHKL